MALYIAYNHALSTTTNVGAGTSLATGSKVTLQLQVPDNQTIRIVEWGWSQDAATATATLAEVATTDTGSTLTTSHTTTTIKPLIWNDARASSLTMATTGTSYGSASITSNTTLRPIHKLYVPQQYVYTWPLGQYPIIGSGSGENFVQVRCNTTATVNVSTWLIWDEA